MEQRSSTRVAFKMGVEIAAGSFRGFTVETRDLSLGGIQVESKTQLAKGIECDLTLYPASGLGIASFLLKAIVMRHTETGMGMAFIHTSRESLLKLVDLLVASGLEEVVEKELQTMGKPRKDIFMM